MRQIFSTFLLLFVLIASSAVAWQPVLIADGASAQKVLFYSEAALLTGDASGATAVQVKNSGTGTMTVSLFRFTAADTSWFPTLPYAAATVGQTYYAIADSTYPIAAGESFFEENIPANKRPHGAYITRSVSTEVKVLWK